MVITLSGYVGLAPICSVYYIAASIHLFTAQWAGPFVLATEILSVARLVMETGDKLMFDPYGNEIRKREQCMMKCELYSLV